MPWAFWKTRVDRSRFGAGMAPSEAHSRRPARRDEQESAPTRARARRRTGSRRPPGGRAADSRRSVPQPVTGARPRLIVDRKEARLADSRIIVRNNGPLRIEGDNIVLTDQDGKTFGLAGRMVVSLCRCGQSANKPFCDGTHNKIGFDSSVPGARPAAASAAQDALTAAGNPRVSGILRPSHLAARALRHRRAGPRGDALCSTSWPARSSACGRCCLSAPRATATRRTSVSPPSRATRSSSAWTSSSSRACSRKEDVAGASFPETEVDYGAVIDFKQPRLQTAYERAPREARGDGALRGVLPARRRPGSTTTPSSWR